MRFFLDTANISEVETLAETGLVDGVTTNPSLIAKTGLVYTDILRDICKIIKGPVSAEVTATDDRMMMKEALILADIAENICIKVPLTPAGLKTCFHLNQRNIAVNVTLCFSASQALLAAKSGATFISPFIGRLDDLGHDGLQLLEDIRDIYSNYPEFQTEILAASVRSVKQVVEAARMGIDVVTLPPKIFQQLYVHPLTDKGLDMFLADWAKTGQSLLPDEEC